MSFVLLSYPKALEVDSRVHMSEVHDYCILRKSVGNRGEVHTYLRFKCRDCGTVLEARLSGVVSNPTFKGRCLNCHATYIAEGKYKQELEFLINLGLQSIECSYLTVGGKKKRVYSYAILS